MIVRTGPLVKCARMTALERNVIPPRTRRSGNTAGLRDEAIRNTIRKETLLRLQTRPQSRRLPVTLIVKSRNSGATSGDPARELWSKGQRPNRSLCRLASEQWLWQPGGQQQLLFLPQSRQSNLPDIHSCLLPVYGAWQPRRSISERFRPRGVAEGPSQPGSSSRHHTATGRTPIPLLWRRSGSKSLMDCRLCASMWRRRCAASNRTRGRTR